MAPAISSLALRADKVFWAAARSLKSRASTLLAPITPAKEDSCMASSLRWFSTAMTAKAANTKIRAAPVDRNEMIVSFWFRLERANFSMAHLRGRDGEKGRLQASFAEITIPAEKIYGERLAVSLI